MATPNTLAAALPPSAPHQSTPGEPFTEPNGYYGRFQRWMDGGLTTYYEDNAVSERKRKIQSILFYIAILVWIGFSVWAIVEYVETRDKQVVSIDYFTPDPFSFPAFVVCSNLDDPLSAVDWAPDAGTTAPLCNYTIAGTTGLCTTSFTDEGNYSCYVFNIDGSLKFQSTSDSIFGQINFQYSDPLNRGVSPYLLVGATVGEVTAPQNNLITVAGSGYSVVRLAPTYYDDVGGYSGYLFTPSASTLPSTVSCPVGSGTFCTIDVVGKLQTLRTERFTSVQQGSWVNLVGNIGGYLSLAETILLIYGSYFITMLLYRKYTDRIDYNTRESILIMIRERVRPEAMIPRFTGFVAPERPLPPRGHKYYMGGPYHLSQTEATPASATTNNNTNTDSHNNTNTSSHNSTNTNNTHTHINTNINTNTNNTSAHTNTSTNTNNNINTDTNPAGRSEVASIYPNIHDHLSTYMNNNNNNNGGILNASNYSIYSSGTPGR